MWEEIKNYLKVKELMNGFVYRIYARNGEIGIWDAEKKGFKIARTKFRDTFIDTEYHWDVDPRFGTAKPYETLWLAPEMTEEDMVDYLKDLEHKFDEQDKKDALRPFKENWRCRGRDT